MDIEITPLTRSNADEAFSLTCEVFVADSTLHQSVGITLDEYREYMRVYFDAMWKQGLSVVANDRTSDAIVGCLLACDYEKQTVTSEEVPEKLRPVNALLKSLDEIYRHKLQTDAGLRMLVDMALVKPAARGRGVYRKMRETAHQTGREAGFIYVIGELSSSATQHLCIEKFGHKVRAEIPFASFQYQGKKPFSAISDPASIVLVEGNL